MDPITVSIAIALATGLVQVTQKIVEKGVIDPALEPVTERLKQWVQRHYRQAETEAAADQALQKAVQSALEAAGAPVDDSDKLERYARQASLDKLWAKQNEALRRHFARTVIAFIDSKTEPPEDLVVALNWPRGQRRQLTHLLAALRAELYTLDDWRTPIDYANEAARRGTLDQMLNYLERLDNVFVATDAGEALRVVVVKQGLTETEAAAIEEAYRAELVRDLRLHDFRGIVQVKRAIRLPLADIYLELGLLRLGGQAQRNRAREEMLAMREEERLAEEEKRLQDRVSDALARFERLVILGEPGAGKTMTLNFIALMLAYGYGAVRLGLEVPYIPLKVRLADFARELEQRPALTLDNYLFEIVKQAYASHERLDEFLRLALEKGACLVLLDGLDEVGDDPVRGQSLRQRVAQRVQQFADRWCIRERRNRLVVTSRIEGYWDEPVAGLEHVQLSPLQPPEEVGEFLRRWFTAYEQAQDSQLPLEIAEQRAEARVDELLPRMMAWASVRRLATNPLLLTILALIHETVGKLPNRRIKLYEICAQTLIESWRQAQMGLPDEWLAELGEETVIRVMAPLAYWLHEVRPGGTASFQEWQQRLKTILIEEGFEEEAAEIADRFLHHARFQAGLLAERGLGQFGFFHLTFEEYLAAREIARQRAERRREMVLAHWEDPRWNEILLLAAGQLGIAEAKTYDASDFVEDLLKAEPAESENEGRQAVLAGRALADIGPRSVTRKTRHWVEEDLRYTMQDLDSRTKQSYDPPRIPVHTRYDAGEALDELGWLPDDLNAWVLCQGCADSGGDLYVMKYPVTNAHFERFVEAGGYNNPAYWGGEESKAWQWLQNPPNYRGAGLVWEPEYWTHPRFGRERRGYPVVGVSWYEARAYAAWLADILRRIHVGEQVAEENRALVTGLLAASVAEIRLPTEAEWEKIAGGVAGERYPWDALEGSATKDEDAVLARANVRGADLGGTSPVAMYPLGISRPFGLADLAGNVWEWMENERGVGRALRGGSWSHNHWNARVSAGVDNFPFSSNYYLGFRLVSPVVSGS